MNKVIQIAAFVGGGILGVGAVANMQIPIAMSTFGTIISGVGSVHAAGGVAATLQATAAYAGTYTTQAIVVIGAEGVRRFIR
jgi:hypothetical protein